jgi:hypothetical protein
MIYITVPVSEPPTETGWYNCYDGSNFLGQDYFLDGKFAVKSVTHWLKPVTTLAEIIKHCPEVREEFEKLYSIVHEDIMQARIKIWKMKDDKNISIAAIDDIISDLSMSAPQKAIDYINSILNND